MQMLQFSRDGGPHTAPLIYETGPMPLCGTLDCRQGRGEPCATGCELTAQADAARIGGGNQAPSEPAPLDESVGGFWHRVRDDDIAAARGIFGWAIAAVLVYLALALGARLF
jgi:hypothetical protein